MRQELLYGYHAIAGNVAHSPLHGGVQIYHPTKRAAGTISCVVTRGGKPYLLSNQHVFGVATEGKASYDFTNKMQVAVVVDTASRDPKGEDYVDAALAAPLLPVSFEIPRVGIPKGHVEPKKDMKVKMFGFKSGYQTGKILEVTNKYDLRSTSAALAQGKLGVIRHSIATQPGDSGSLLLNEQNLAVGLVFGTGSNVTGSLACKATAIVRAYPGISFVGKSGIMQPAIKQPVPLPPAKNTNEPKVVQAGVLPSIDLDKLMPGLSLDQNTILLGVIGIGVLFMLSRGK